MKTLGLSVIIQLLLALVALADIKVTSVEQPAPGQIVERSIVTLLRFKVSGISDTLKTVIIRRDGTEGNGMFGEYILVSEEDGIVRAKTTIDTDGYIRFNVGDFYTTESSLTYAVRLRALSFLRQYGGNEVTLKLTSLEVESGSSVGELPIVGPKFTINPNPIIGNVLLYPEKRLSTNELMVNVSGQELGRFRADVWQIEPIVVSNLVFYTQSPNHSDPFGTITSVTIEDEKGQIVAGPVDAVSWGEAADQQIIRFTDTIVFPTGRSVYTIRGRLSPAGFNYNSLVGLRLATNEWKFVGAGDGFEFEAWSRDFDLDYAPVNTGVVDVILEPNGGSVVVPGGSKQTELGRFNLLTYGSAEDLRLIKLRLCFTGGGSTSVKNLQVYSGNTSLSQAAPVNVTAEGPVNIILDKSLLISKGGEVDLSVRADIDEEEQTRNPFQMTICGNSSDGFGFMGVVTASPPFVHVPIQVGTYIWILPRIYGIGFLDQDGKKLVNLWGIGVPNTSYLVEGSTNMADWEILGEFHQGSSTTIKEVAVAMVPAGDKYASQGFFRLRVKP